MSRCDQVWGWTPVTPTTRRMKGSLYPQVRGQPKQDNKPSFQIKTRSTKTRFELAKNGSVGKGTYWSLHGGENWLHAHAIAHCTPTSLTHINKYTVKNSSVWWHRPKSPPGGVGRRKQQPISVWPGHTECRFKASQSTDTNVNECSKQHFRTLVRFPVCFRSEIWRTAWREPLLLIPKHILSMS